MKKLYEKSDPLKASALKRAGTGCCPRFDPKPWEDKEVKWKDKLFVKDR